MLLLLVLMLICDAAASADAGVDAIGSADNVDDARQYTEHDSRTLLLLKQKQLVMLSLYIAVNIYVDTSAASDAGIVDAADVINAAATVLHDADAPLSGTFLLHTVSDNKHQTREISDEMFSLPTSDKNCFCRMSTKVEPILVGCPKAKAIPVMSYIFCLIPDV